jgi:DNA-binding NtrC family response regulator
MRVFAEVSAGARLGMPLALGWNVLSSRPSTTPVVPEPAVTVRQSSDAGTAIVSVPTSGVDLEAVERALIVFALDTTCGNRTRAAKLLRLTRSALLYRLQKYGLAAKQGSS